MSTTTRNGDIGVYERQGFGQSRGIQGRIGLLIVDFVNGFADPAIFGGGNIQPAYAHQGCTRGGA
jgi:hypothetical protein